MTEFKLVGHQNTYQIENIIRLYDKYLKDVYIISILKDNTCRAEIYDNNNLIVYKEEKSPKDPKLQKQKLASVYIKL